MSSSSTRYRDKMKGRATKAQVRVHRPIISEKDLDNLYQIRRGRGFY